MSFSLHSKKIYLIAIGEWRLGRFEKIRHRDMLERHSRRAESMEISIQEGLDLSISQHGRHPVMHPLDK